MGDCVFEMLPAAVQLSLAVAEEAKFVIENWQLAFAATVWLDGQLMLGKVWSATVKVKTQVPVLLLWSVALSVTV